MRIGIDAKWYFEGPASGHRVVRNLVDFILKLDSRNEFVIFLDRRHVDRDFPEHDRRRIKLCHIWAGNNALANIFLIPYYARRLQVDVVLAQTFVSPFGAAKQVAYIHDVLFLSNPEFYTIYERLYFAPLRLLTKSAELIVTVSHEEKRRLLKYRYAADDKKIIVAYHGVEPAFKPRESFSSNDLSEVSQRFRLPARFILFVGRLNLRKNVEHVLRALPLLNDKTIKLVIVGADDWKKSNHAKVINELGIRDRVIFTGGVYKELPLIYSLATVFCFPSYAESFGMPPVEAMAAGVPVVTSNTTCLPEICEDAAIYVDPRDSRQIADAIDSLLANTQLYLEMRRKGLDRAAEFSWEKTVRVVADSIDSLNQTLS